MLGHKQAQLRAQQLFKLSVIGGRVSAEHVAGCLAYVEKTPAKTLGAPALAVLKAYRRLIATELARGEARIEHAGPVTSETIAAIAAAMTKRYQRPVTASATPQPTLLAGLRVRVGDDVYESSVSGQLATLRG
jgi:F-type H+-transporting ATPase subunit delta